MLAAGFLGNVFATQNAQLIARSMPDVALGFRARRMRQSKIIRVGGAVRPSAPKLETDARCGSRFLNRFVNMPGVSASSRSFTNNAETPELRGCASSHLLKN